VNIPIVVRYGPYPILKDRAEYTATVLRELGYQVSVEPVEPGAPAAVTDRYQLQVRLGWVPDYPLPGSYYDGLVACDQPTDTHYCNPTIQALVDRARSIRLTDPAGSLDLWRQADRLLTDDAAIVPLMNRVAAVVVRPELGNVMTRSGYGPLIDQIWVT
jgi:peptide/nickel transport system substrate-binding protein